MYRSRALRPRHRQAARTKAPPAAGPAAKPPKSRRVVLLRFSGSRACRRPLDLLELLLSPHRRIPIRVVLAGKLAEAF